MLRSFSIMFFPCIVLAALTAVNTVVATASSRPLHIRQANSGRLRSGEYDLVVTASDVELPVSVKVGNGSAVLTEEEPLQVIVKNGDTATEVNGVYTSVQQDREEIVATGKVESTGGSGFSFEDRYAVASAGGFSVSRTVTVGTANSVDEGFNSRFTIGFAGSRAIQDYEVLVPGVWYNHNEHVPAGALASDLSNDYFYFLETRLPLPFIMMHDPDSGLDLSLGHQAAQPATTADEASGQWQVGDGITYAALGAQQIPSTKVAIVYPGIEGEKNYIDPAALWVYRSNPVTTGFNQSYEFRIRVDETSDFSLAVQESWRYHWHMANLEIAEVPVEQVYSASIDLLASYVQDHNGAPGLPFSASIPGGETVEISFQMGFVGQQLPAAHLLLREGYLNGKQDLLDKGRRILNFWAANSPVASGLPRTWYDINPGSWRASYPTYLRIATDGMEGVLKACLLERNRGTPVMEWESFIQGFGDWLVANQNEDGSYYRAYNLEGTGPEHDATYNTHNAVPFLLGLSNYTGEASYREAALKAGEFAYNNVHLPAAYVGGTPDNDNVFDKEAAALALRAFLSLYDYTNERRYLDAAQRAADFAETWSYAWTYPVASDREAYARYGVRGQSLIATGHSGMDVWHSGSLFDIYRLYRVTGDPHYLEYAQLLANEAKLTTQYPENLVGYAMDGLVEEAVDMSGLSYDGVSIWLPWLSVSHAEPLALLEDTFGDMNINAL